jgi:L-rhamnonate dehydratase
MKIKDIKIFKLKGYPREITFKVESRQAQPLDIYPEYNTFTKQQQSGWEPEIVEHIYMEIEPDSGTPGLFGPIDETQAFIIKKHLLPFLKGKNPLDIQLLHDKMLRLNRHGRSGYFLMASSAVDCALWDLKGKAEDKPVYELLGRKRDSVPAYASMLGHSIEPEKAAQKAEEYKDLGYTAQKWFFRYGPGNGKEGMEKNLSMAKAVRQAVGDDYPIMFDAFMSWDLEYAIEMLKKLEPVRPFWVEEPFFPEQVSDFKKLKQSTSINIATGEHVYTRYQFETLLMNDVVDILQPDPDWTGGITELIEICRLAEKHEKQIVCHGHSLHPALHIAAAHAGTTIPWVEYLIQNLPRQQHFHKKILWPEKGMIKLPSAPGLGIEINEEAVNEKA